MDKEIKYTGLRADVSDYDSADGSLSVCHNVINETGSLCPTGRPEEVFRLDNQSDVVLCTHKVNNILHYIVARNESEDGRRRTVVVWYEAGGVPQGHLTVPTIFETEEVRSAVVMGNFVVFSTSEGVVYALFRDGDYVYLGGRPELPVLEFGLEKAAELEKSTYKIDVEVDKEVYESCKNLLPSVGSGASKTHQRTSSGQAKSKTDIFLEKVTNGVIGYLLDEYTRFCEERGLLFYQPFMVRYAFRLYDGSYLWHSSPMLMLPTTLMPLIEAVADGAEVKEGSSEYIYSFYPGGGTKFFRLLYRVVGDVKLLPTWQDVVTGVDVFISAPIYTYDQSASVTGMRSYRLLDGIKTTVVNGHGGRGETVYMAELKVVDGIYRDGEPVDVAMPVCVKESPIYDSANKKFYWALKERGDLIFDDIRNCAQFYHVASLEVDDLERTDVFKALDIDKGVTPNSLVARRTLPDDYMSMHTLYPEYMSVYNSRLHVGNVKIELGAAPPLRTVFHYVDVDINGEDVEAMDVTRVALRYRKNGEDKTVIREGNNELDRFVDPNRSLPIFFYLPDADAKQLDVYYRDGESGVERCYSFALKASDVMNGAYFLDDFYVLKEGDKFNAQFTMHDAQSGYRSSELAESSEISENSEQARGTELGLQKAWASKPSTIYLSEANNPLVFPAVTAVTLPAEVMALSSAAKALSQGQFGQFPLYAFTTEGVWALELTQTGSYTAVQPVTRDVCNNVRGITQIDSAVLFPTAKGIMLLSGATAQCVSDTLVNAQCTMHNAQSSSELRELERLCGFGIEGLMRASVDFRDYVRGCEMVYDYVRQRIIVFNEAYGYAYVWSLKSQQWSTIDNDLVYSVPSYPEAVAVAHGGRVVRYGDMLDYNPHTSGVYVQGIVSRALKLELADVLKTVQAAVTHGEFRRGHVVSALYGSRDMLSWHRVWTSTSHELRGFSGTPYKWFKIALLCNLDPGESVSGTALRFVPKQYRKLR